ncbi:MAG TPA: site-2 protease family protein [Gemmatimonadales bacterium]|nr:site-2 protease family protein [Gemmatimonadales bacterium]
MTTSPGPSAGASTCPSCGTELAPALLACPACGRLVHAERLKTLAATAERQVQAGDLSAGLAAWREALDLLPPTSRQHATVAATVLNLSKQVDGDSSGTTGHSRQGRKAAQGAAGIGVVAALLGKAKLLILGLTKASTFLSMLAFAGVYWTLWGWKFGVGMAVSIYIHEMGHVFALQRYGIKASPPMFIPGFGAVVRLKQYPADPREDARVGLAGPLWGLGAAAAAYGVYYLTSAPIWAALAQLGAFINLFNLIPVWQLDGARGFHALSRTQRWLVVAVIAVMWVVTSESLLVILLLTAAYAAWRSRSDGEGDATALWQFAGLVSVLSLMTRIPVPGGALR